MLHSVIISSRRDVLPEASRRPCSNAPEWLLHQGATHA
jgi:hypothetical protein